MLGRDDGGRQVALSDRQLEAHALIVGASGAGKTTTLQTILAQQIARGRPVVAIDMKGSPAFASELADAASAAGRRLTRLATGRADPLEPARSTADRPRSRTA